MWLIVGYVFVVNFLVQGVLAASSSIYVNCVFVIDLCVVVVRCVRRLLASGDDHMLATAWLQGLRWARRPALHPGHCHTSAEIRVVGVVCMLVAPR